jgi:ABC-type multidrug transport system fused ATPase/permease subunit
MISFITILWAISPFAPFIIIVMSVPSAIINFIYRKKNFLYIRHRSKDRRQLSYYSGLMTNKDLVKEIRIFGLSDLFIGRYRETFKKYFTGLRKLFVSEGTWNISITVITSAVNCLLYLFIAWKVCKGEIQVGDYTLYTGALASIAGGINAFISTTATIYEGTLFIDNMILFMNEKRTVAPLLDIPLHVKHHSGHQIVFENVSFRYPGTERDVIKNVSLTFNAGDTVVLVGLNGAGKTTLIKLLTRLYDPTEGRILLDGHDIRDYDVEEMYKLFGIIFQDFGKYAVSVTENISFGRLEKPFISDNVKFAAEQSNSASFIEALPDKYNTPLMRYFEDNGIELSTGQWQKLAIARAFYSDSDILILDEPTASLDAIAEQEIYNQFDLLRKDKLTIFVSHRLSSATVASKIIVLENGAVIEEGNHAELMRLGGHYYKLFSTQAKRYMTPVEGMQNNSDTISDSVISGENGTGENFTAHPYESGPGIGKPPFDKKPLQGIGKPTR